jgi:hypothetical protein
MEPSAVIPIDLELATLETLERPALIALIVEKEAARRDAGHD